MPTEGLVRAFPYHEIWEDFSDDWVTIEQLWPRQMIFRARFRLLSAAGSPTPMVETTCLLPLMQELDLLPDKKQDLAEELFLVAGYYLEPEHLKQWQTDVRSSARTLKKIGKLARDLSAALQQISGPVSRALVQQDNFDPGRANPESKLDLPHVSKQIADLEHAAETMVGDISNRKLGRRTNTVRLNALQLILARLEAAGLGKATTSQGNKRNPEPHFTGALGEFVRDFFKLIAPKLSERTLVQNAGQVRRSRRQ